MHPLSFLVVLVACVAPWAHADTVSSSARHHLSSLQSGRESASKSLIAGDGYWRAELIKAGFINEDGPVRAVLPIAKFGETGQKLILTYGKVPHSLVRSKAVLLMLQVPVK